jgi:RNA polymerase sigma factor (sigma-70 family)
MSQSDWETDAILLAQWRDGDKRAGSRLFGRHGDVVLRFFRNKVSFHETEELAQETFLRLVKTRDQIEDGRMLRAWVLGIARRVLLEHLRKLPLEGEFDPSVHKIADIVPGASTIIARCQEQEVIVNALRRLPLAQQILLELCYWEKLKGPELARIMDVNASTMRSRIQKARDALRDTIATLNANPELIKSTLAGLEDWADQIRVEHLRGFVDETRSHAQEP